MFDKLKKVYLYIKYYKIIQEIEQSGLFDKAFYIEQSKLRKFKKYPIFHYLYEGQAKKIAFNPDFDADYYEECYPEVREMGALLHYIRCGQFEERVTKRPQVSHVLSFEELEARVPKIKDLDNKQKLAVVCHVYYVDLWAEIAENIQKIAEAFDLYVTVSDHNRSTNIEEQIVTAFPSANVYFFPNHGRDIFPFMTLVNEGVLDDYDAICKLHTKKSPHREDGEQWRQHLIGQILDAPKTIEQIVASIRENNTGIVIADGQIFEGEEWLGSNLPIIEALAARIEMNMKRIPMRFAGGSIFWINGLVVQMLKRFELGVRDYPQESGQIDGTTHHAIERMISYLCHEGDYDIKQVTEIKQEVEQGNSIASGQSKPMFIAFYLPQYHPIPENDAWWGKGFTEWRNVTKAEPMFLNHHQPRRPADFGYYDLRVAETQAAQAKLAQEFGVDAFCYYYYWFDGRKVLETPLESMLANPDVDIPFCLCWANENWTRTWDGLDNDVLLGQDYENDFAERIFMDMLPAFKDKRYLKYDDKLLFIVYRPTKIKNFSEAAATWRALADEHGLGSIHIAGVNFHLDDETIDEAALGLDSVVLFPPHGLIKEHDFIRPENMDQSIIPNLANVRGDFQGLIYDYENMLRNEIVNATNRPIAENQEYFRGVTLGWDNTARKGVRGHISYGCNPMKFRKWLNAVVTQEAQKHQKDFPVFINAWNEWAEGTYLEPDEKYQRDYLKIVKSMKRSNERD